MTTVRFINVCFNEILVNNTGNAETGKFCLFNAEMDLVLAGYFIWGTEKEMPWVKMYESDIETGARYPMLDFSWIANVLAPMVKFAIQVRKEEGDWKPSNYTNEDGIKIKVNSYRKQVIDLGKDVLVKVWAPEPIKKLMTPDEIKAKFGDLPF